MRISLADLKILIIFGLFVSSIIVLSFYFNYYLFGMVVFSTMIVVFLISHLYGAPWFPSADAVVKKMVHMAKIAKGDVVYDLGSGDARILIEASRRRSGIRLTGVEINPISIIGSKLLLKILGLGDKIKIRRQNFFKANLRDADVIFVFLLQKTNDRLEKKLKKELKKGTRIVSHLWKFKNMKLVRADERLKVYLYRA